MTKHKADNETLDLIGAALDGVGEWIRAHPADYRAARLYSHTETAFKAYLEGRDSAFVSVATAAAIARADGDEWTARLLHIAGERIIRERGVL